MATDYSPELPEAQFYLAQQSALFNSYAVALSENR